MTDNDQTDTLEYERDLWELEYRQRSFRRIQQIFQLYTVLGVVTGVVALAFYFFRKIQIDLSTEDRTILLVAGSGFAISIFSALYLFFKSQTGYLKLERGRYISSASEFLVQWARFESMGRRKLDATGKKFNRTSVRELISKLTEAKILTVGDSVLLEEALRFRNFLVHSGSRVEQEQLSRMTAAVQEIVKRLEI